MAWAHGLSLVRVAAADGGRAVAIGGYAGQNAPVRERVHLSRRKLAQFSQTRSSGGFLRRLHDLDGRGSSRPGSSPAGRDARSPDNAELRQVVRYIEETARSFDEDDVSAGEWVRFEAALYVATVGLAEWGHVANLYAEPEPAGFTLFWAPEDWEATPTRLVLLTPPEEMLADRFRPPMLAPPMAVRNYLLRLLPTLSALAIDEHHPDPDQLSAPLPRELRLLDDAAWESRSVPEWFTGYARVLLDAPVSRWARSSAARRRCLVASPLYVERTPGTAGRRGG